MLLSLDPGSNAGWALFTGKILTGCGCRSMPTDQAKQITRIVIERPHTAQTRARRKDIITLAIRAGELGGIWSFITGVVPEYVEPGRWKGSASKEITAKRIVKRLNAQEQSIFQAYCKTSAKSLQHNALDAIGIGLHTLGRFT